MTYSFSRKINPKRFFPNMEYESVDFTVEGARSPQEAQYQCEAWIEEWLREKKGKPGKRNPDNFEKELKATIHLQPPLGGTYEEKKTK